MRSLLNFNVFHRSFHRFSHLVSPCCSPPKCLNYFTYGGPGFIDTDFEDTLKSMGSVSDSPSSRKHHSLGGLAGSSANVVAADKKAGKVVTPQHSARSSRPPVRAAVPTRSPRTEVQAQERLLGHTLPPQ